MSNIQIKRHNFDVAKNKVKQLSSNLPSYPSFTKVEEDGGLFGWGDHKVTGTEMNNSIREVQNKIIDVNSSLREIVYGFDEVYNTFNFLDKEYISGIIESVEEAEKASNQALKAQTETNKTVQNLKTTVEKLANLKSTVESIEKRVNEQDSNKIKEYNAYYYMKYTNLEDKITNLERKIKIAYYIGGGAIGLSLINYILQIIGVL